VFYIDTLVQSIDNGLLLCLIQMVSWIGFCQNTLLNKEIDILVVDYFGFCWKCDLKFDMHNNSVYCIIGGDWGMICKVRCFAE